MFMPLMMLSKGLHDTGLRLVRLVVSTMCPVGLRLFTRITNSSAARWCGSRVMRRNVRCDIFGRSYRYFDCKTLSGGLDDAYPGMIILVRSCATDEIGG
jgi:hypothetical protein